MDLILWLKPMLIQCNFKWIWSSAFNCLKSIKVQWLFVVNRTIAHYLLYYLYNPYLIVYKVCSSNIGIMDQVKVCHLFGTKPVPELMMIYCQSNLRNKLPWDLLQKCIYYRNAFKMSSAKWGPLVSCLNVINIYCIVVIQTNFHDFISC